MIQLANVSQTVGDQIATAKTLVFLAIIHSRVYGKMVSVPGCMENRYCDSTFYLPTHHAWFSKLNAWFSKLNMQLQLLYNRSSNLVSLGRKTVNMEDILAMVAEQSTKRCS